MILAAKPRTKAFAGHNTAMVSESLASFAGAGAWPKGVRRN